MLRKLGFISLAALVLFSTGCGCSKKEDEKKKEEVDSVINNNEGVIKDQNYDGLDIVNTSLVTENGVSTFITSITNNTGSDYYVNQLVITVKDADGNVIKTLPAYVGATIAAGQTRMVNVNIDADLSKAEKVEYSVTK